MFESITDRIRQEVPMTVTGKDAVDLAARYRPVSRG